ncbi:MAG TPA: T9SS type A sorting domain-containing protein, partial [Bacteroidia bacterium]|nr:T9SS type A sorting domain-containing protein [Bacteroidia bacterium]
DGNMLRTDATVYKLDVNLNPVGQFTYGNTFPGTGVALDGYDNIGNDGLSTFADFTPSVFSPNQNFHHIKSYYNGQSGCNEDIQVPVLQFIPPPMVFPVPANAVSNVIASSNVLKTSRVSVAVNNTLCFNLSIPGGSNARVAPDEQSGDGAASVSPNPMQQGIAAALLEVNTEVAMDVDVAIYDMLGRQYYNNRFSLVSGENRLPLELSDANMAQGTYIVKITGTDFNKNITLLVK